jgi:hypothetical protein
MGDSDCVERPIKRKFRKVDVSRCAKLFGIGLNVVDNETHGLRSPIYPAVYDVWTDTKINSVFVLKHSSQCAVLNLAKDTRLYSVTFIVFFFLSP